MEQEKNTSKKKAKEKGSGKKNRRTVTIVLLFVLAVVAAIAAKFVYDISHPETLFSGELGFEEATPEPTASSTPTPETSITPDAVDATPDPEQELASEADITFMQNRVNILVLGLDESVERANWGAFRTDTMILVSINFDTNDVDMISIPRDSYVKIANASGKPINKFGKVNSAFPTGGGAQKNGYAYAMGTISYLLGGVPIDYYVGFNMNVVKEVVNAMGGVDYEVDIEVRMNGRELHPGFQHMDGQAVLDYCRQRKGSSDIARVDRQQRMIMAIIKQMKDTNQVVNIPKIYKALEQNIQTNLSFTQVSSLALLALRMDMSQLSRQTLAGEFLDMYGTSYWGLNVSKIKSMVKEIFGLNVTLDSDVDAKNVKAKIEEERLLISSELGSANRAIANAEYILNSFNDWLAGDTSDRLRTLKSQLEDAMDEQDKELLDYYTPRLKQLNEQIFNQLVEFGANVQAPAWP